MSSLTRRIRSLEAVHGHALQRCGIWGGYDPANPPLAITRHARPLAECPECGLHLDDDGQPLPPHYKRIVLDRPEAV